MFFFPLEKVEDLEVIVMNDNVFSVCALLMCSLFTREEKNISTP